MPYKHRHKAKERDYVVKCRVKTKLEVLSHYGYEGQMRCAWPECFVTDPDMLTLDHIDNNGAERRRNGESRGFQLYIELRNTEYPEGFQTLCFNHNFKKEIMRRNANRMNEIKQYANH